MARNDGMDRLCVRNNNLTDTKIGNVQRHNEREKESYTNPDVVPDRTSLNIHYKTCEDSYQHTFDQIVADGTISTRGLKSDAKKYGELVFDVNSAYFYNHGGYEYAKKFYADAYKAAIQIVDGEQYILSAVMHADERNRAMSEALGQDVYHYHLHVVYVPVVEKQVLWTKRCKDPALLGTVKETVMQVSSSKKWNSQPAIDETGKPILQANGKPVLRKSYTVLQDDVFRFMRDAGYTDIERGERGSSEEHLTVTQFKVQKEQERLTVLQEQSEEMNETLNIIQKDIETSKDELNKTDQTLGKKQKKLNEIAPILSNTKALAAQYSTDAEEALPPAGTFETAKSYRENKIKPLFKSIIKTLRSVYRSFMELTKKYEKLEEEYDRVFERSENRLRRIDELIAEKNEWKDQAMDLQRVKRMIGSDRVDDLIQESKMIEHRERERQRLRKRSRSVWEL